MERSPSAARALQRESMTDVLIIKNCEEFPCFVIRTCRLFT